MRGPTGSHALVIGALVDSGLIGSCLGGPCLRTSRDENLSTALSRANPTDIKGAEMNMTDAEQSRSKAESSWSPIVELRQYTLHPGQRDNLVDLFEREFIEPQEELGMRVLGQFDDLDDPNRFVWLRGFEDMHTRAKGLAAFYGGPVWKQHRDVANATMVDSDNVLLLRPARPGSGFSPDSTERPPRHSHMSRRGCVAAGIYAMDAQLEGAFVDFVEERLRPVLSDVGAALLAYFATESSPNTFPTLPVRDGEFVFVWLAGFPVGAAPEAVTPGGGALGGLMPNAPTQMQPIQVLRLAPTARSALTGSSPPCPAISLSGSERGA
jgi:NIPSNAP